MHNPNPSPTSRETYKKQEEFCAWVSRFLAKKIPGELKTQPGATKDTTKEITMKDSL